jgi:GlpG protein
MRQIGTVPQARDAQRLADYLLTLGIRCRVDAQEGGTSVWVYDEDQREPARRALDEFLAHPDDPRYDEAARQARALERAAATQEKQYRKNVVDLRNRWQGPGSRRRPVTIALVALSCAVVFMFGFGDQADSVARLADLWITPPVFIDGRVGLEPLTSTLDGQLWRLVTPIFIHMSAMHLLFNMFWIFDLGTMIELRIGSWRTAGMVLAIAVLSNLGEYWWDVQRHQAPFFGGMSGVVYGLFGYIWIRGRMDPMSGFYLQPSTVTIMLAWFFLCFTPLLGHVANGAHAAGLASGMAFAYGPVLWRQRRL